MSEEIQKVDAPIIDANPHVEDQVTPATTDPEVDYKTKFSESSKEAIRLLEETKAKDAEIERLRQLAEQGANYSDNSDIIPGFDQLSDEEQRNLAAYTEGIRRKALDEIKKDPALAFARETYNERKWESAFEEAASKFPELRESRDDFKKKYYNASNVPENIGSIIEDLSKVYLFDRARELGAKDALEKANRIDIERQQAGDKTPVASRSLEDWHKLAQSNPMQFAKLSKEYKSDLESGKLK